MRFFSPTVLTADSLLTGAPILAQEPSDVAKNVRMMVSGIVQLHPLACAIRAAKLCIFSSSRFSTAHKRMPRHLCLICLSSFTQQEAMISGCNVLFWQRVTDIQME